jgi:hypothetical protein
LFQLRQRAAEHRHAIPRTIKRLGHGATQTLSTPGNNGDSRTHDLSPSGSGHIRPYHPKNEVIDNVSILQSTVTGVKIDHICDAKCASIIDMITIIVRLAASGGVRITGSLSRKRPGLGEEQPIGRA